MYKEKQKEIKWSLEQKQQQQLIMKAFGQVDVNVGIQLIRLWNIYEIYLKNDSKDTSPQNHNAIRIKIYLIALLHP